MDELPDTEDIIKKLKSSLPICRVCLDFSMEYIEFEATLCVVNGREITFSEGFHDLISDNKDLPQQIVTAYFCAMCGKDLLNAYLFLKRIEHANYVLNKVKILADESSKFLFDDHDYSNDYKNEEKRDVIYFPKAEPASSKENYGTEICEEKSEDKDIAEDTGSNISSVFDGSLKIKNLEEEYESKYEAVYNDEVSMEKEELNEDEFEPERNRRYSESAMWVSSEFGYLSEEDLEKQALNSQGNKLTKCIHCNKLLENNDIKSHMLMFHEYFNLDHNNECTEKKDYICNVCSCTFETKRILNFHKRRTHKVIEKNYQKEQEYNKCPYCRRIIRKSNMEKHLLTHSADTDKEYNDTGCEETFPTKIDVKPHSYIHTKNRYVCQICGKICMRPFTLRKHIQAKHLSERRKHQCEDCGLFFTFPSFLKQHQRKHNMNNRFKCSQCDRTFIRKQQLDIHMRYHLNDFPYKCDQCDKCYVSKSNLTDHVRSKHTKTTYDCNRCQQKFKSQTGLRKHKYAHDGYPYNCPLCSIGQTSRSGMKQHLMGVHKDALTEEEFDSMFPIIIPRTGYRRPKLM